MALRDSDAVLTELDKLALIDPDEDGIAYIKSLVERGDSQAHIEIHISAYERDSPTVDTTAVRVAING